MMYFHACLQRPPMAHKRLQLYLLAATSVKVDCVVVGTHHVAGPCLIDALSVTIDANACTCSVSRGLSVCNLVVLKCR